MRYVAGQPAERILPPGVFCEHRPGITTGEPLSTEERIRIPVWNIYKQQRAEWLSVLKNYGKDAHLVLLQEAQTTPELVQFATANYLAADQVLRFRAATTSFRCNDPFGGASSVLLPVT